MKVSHSSSEESENENEEDMEICEEDTKTSAT